MRIWATARYLHLGLFQFPANWYHLALSTDLRTTPELVPDLPEDSDLRFENLVIKSFKGDAEDKVIAIIGFVFLFLPSVIYRWYLKSTAWIYFPLIWISKVPEVIKGDDGRLEWDGSQSVALLHKIGFWLSIFTLTYGALILIDLAPYFDARQLINEKGLLVTPWLIIVGIDFGKLLPWYWMPLLAAVLQLWGYIWANLINTRIDKMKSYDGPNQKTIKQVLFINNTVGALAKTSIFFGVVTVIVYTQATCGFGANVSLWLETLLGAAACGGG